MSSSTKTIFCVEKCLDSGLIREETTQVRDSGGFRDPGANFRLVRMGTSGFDTSEGALAKAEELRLDRIARFEREVERLKGLQFRCVDPRSAYSQA